ncbi:MAG: 5'/3'-nucleotidase SurE [Planctomycetota bacterium]|jgi:5'-nucleotidase|nr:5'/3'-nucleotidase SurE [Planctomycetota bacterium]
MRILITNDDGIHAPGITALAEAFVEIGEVTVVAPESEQSGVSHALTFLTPFFVQQIDSDHPKIRKFALNGTPSDCTKLGIVELVEEKPDLVISGINGGLNVGINCIYSGTLAGAREGAFFGIPSFAVSLEVIRKGISNPDHIQRAAEWSRDLILELSQSDLPSCPHFNINFPTAALENHSLETGPAEEQTGPRFVPMETQRFEYRYQKGTDPTGRPYYWTEHQSSNITHNELTDLKAVEKGWVSITPMDYDLTDYRQLQRMQGKP